MSDDPVPESVAAATESSSTGEKGNGRALPWPMIVAIGIGVVLIILVLALVLDDNSSDDDSSSGSTAEPSAIVVELQQGLTELGYYSGPIDGIYGDETTAAVVALQEDLGITADGKYGPETHAALVAALEGGSTTTTSGAPASAPTVSLQTSDGLNATLDVASCTSAGPSSIELSARSETSDLTMSASSGSGSIRYNAADGNREGAVESLTVSESGSITSSGSLSLTDDSAEPATYTLTGQCS